MNEKPQGMSSDLPKFATGCLYLWSVIHAFAPALGMSQIFPVALVNNATLIATFGLVITGATIALINKIGRMFLFLGIVVMVIDLVICFFEGVIKIF